LSGSHLIKLGVNIWSIWIQPRRVLIISRSRIVLAGNRKASRYEANSNQKQGTGEGCAMPSHRFNTKVTDSEPQGHPAPASIAPLLFGSLSG
jgi:hypothetical protein